MSDSKSGQGPLFGKRLLITRSAERARGIVAALRALGAESVIAATTTIEEVAGEERDALAKALMGASSFDWLFLTSANSVRACAALLRAEGRDIAELGALQIAVVGEATEEALCSYGLRASLQATRNTSEGLAQLLVEQEPQAARILFVRAAGGREEAVQVLRAAGHDLVLHNAYRSKTVERDDVNLSSALDELRKGAIDGVAFFAPSQVSALCELAPDAAKELARLQVIAAIGPTTAAALAEFGLHANAVADRPTSEHLADKILQAFS